jgi:single-strand DNA-binding protein
MNSINLIGNLVTDLEVKKTKDGTSVLNTRIAVKKINGESNFFNVVIWGKAADNTASRLKKGSKVGIAGRLENNNYTKEDGTTVFRDEVHTSMVEFLDKLTKEVEVDDDSAVF